MRVLISGAGIAGPALAFWLQRFGHEATIVERSPNLRTGGYIIDFWGVGYEVAEKMGLGPKLKEVGYKVDEVRVVRRDGKRVSGFPVEGFVGGDLSHFTSIPRGDLASLIYEKLDGRVETLFGDSIVSMQQTASWVDVTFEHAAPRRYDLVVGADGLHSNVRMLEFGPESEFEKYLGYKAAAFSVHGYPHRDELAYVMYTQVHQQVGRFTMRDGRTMFIFIFTDEERDRGEAHDVQAQKAMLRARFGDSGWECPEILDALDRAEELYYDRVSQIKMPDSWSKGRVALLGDAAYCVSLLAGQGSALAMAGAYILAGELSRAGDDHEKAFRVYHDRFASFAAEKQKGALRFAGFFVPKSKLQLFIRNQAMKLLRVPWLGKRFASSDIVDRIELPDYDLAQGASLL
jgi:2-polyprenyl-6-methoxyphenol hydroxylase-like FAD-dependent oxidoreductase